MKVRAVVISVFAVLLLIVLLQNTQIVNVRLLFWTVSMSRIVLLLVVIVISFLLGYLTHFLLNKRKKKKNSITSDMV
ncbi:MAG: lipopolysaccharide assembly protein LapA domain-containing protein [candidate division KSB1 bacterium]|nr:lipopolysaccharide assembly protein LapA domain-containing protein [candidate division KSB1 bacterium]